MTRRNQLLLAGVALASLSAAALTAQAQTPAPAPTPPSERHVQREVQVYSDGGNEVRIIREGDGSDMRVERLGKTLMIQRGGHRREEMAEHLRTMLQLKPGQEAALKAYAEAMTPERKMILRTDDEAAPKTTPERLAQMEKQLAEHDQAMRSQIEATRRFYGQLDAGQKKVFDELHMAAGMGMMRLVRFDHAMPPMPPMPPMAPMMHPRAPAPPTPPSPPSF